MKDEPRSGGLMILGRCGGGLRLVSYRVRSFEWESYPRRGRSQRGSGCEG
jgi:hypothetical protein